MTTAHADAPSGPTVRRDSPYFGLDFYGEDYGEWLFGRDAERNRIITNLRAARLTLVHAESGVGKSSLLRAGVAWQLREFARESTARRRGARYVPVVYSAWKDDPTPGLIDEIARVVRPFLGDRPLPSLSQDRLDGAIEAAAGALGGNLLVILDQFEEYFLYSSREHPRGRFADDLARCVNRADLPASFLISVREDAYAGLGELFKSRIANVYSNYLHLAHLDRRAAEDAIRKPLLEVYNRQPGVEPVEIEDGLVAAVLDQAQQDGRGLAPGSGTIAKDRGAIALPLVQLVMKKIWDAERKDHSVVLRLSTLETVGGAERILDTHLKDALDGLGSDAREVAIDVFDRLVTESGGKIAQAVPELAHRTHHSEEQVAAVMEELDRVRIVRSVPAPPGQDPVRFRRYEIFHDVLASPINRAIAARQEERAAREQREAREAAERREREQREATEAARQSARKSRRLAVLAGVLLVVSLLAVAVVLVVWRSAVRDKKTAESLQLASDADANLSSDPELSTLLALRAVKIDPIPQAASALAQAVPAVQEIRTITVRDGTPEDASFSPDGTKVVVATSSGRVDVFSASTGARVLSIRAANPGSPLNSAEFSPNGAWILTAGDDGTARLFNARTGHLKNPVLRAAKDEYHVQYYARSAVFSPSGAEVAATADGAHTGYVKIWSLAGKLERTIRVMHVATGTNVVSSVAFSPDASELATANGDNTVRVYDPRTGQLLATLKAPDNSPVNTVAFAGDTAQVGDRYLVASYQDGKAIIWDVRTGNAVGTLDAGGAALGAAFSPGAELVATANDLGQATVWRRATGAPFADLARFADLNSHVGPVNSVAFSPNGKQVVTADEDGTVKVWDAGPRQLLHQVTASAAPLADAVFLPGRPWVVAGSWTGQITFWDPKRGKTRVFPGSRSGIAYLEAATPAYPTLTAINNDGSAVVYRVGNNLGNKDFMKPLPPIPGNDFSIFVVGPRPREGFVGFQDGSGTLFEPVTGKEVSINTGSASTPAAAFNKSGTELLTANDDSTVTLWDARNGKKIRTFRPLTRTAEVFDAAFSPDGTLIVTADELGDATVFDASNGRRLAVLNAGTGLINTASFAPGNDYEILTAGDDGTARIWDWKTGAQLTVFSAPGSGAVNTAVFSADGSEVLTASADGTLRVWSTRLATSSLPALVRTAERTVTRGLTPEERAQYLAGTGA